MVLLESPADGGHRTAIRIRSLRRHSGTLAQATPYLLSVRGARTYRRSLAVFVAALSLVACGSGAAVTERVRDVTPFAKDGSLRAGVRVTETKHGTCEPGSDALPNDVYRCNFANYVVDPCWRDRHAVRPSVVCLIRPWDTTALRILLSARLPQSTGQADLRAEPWAIRLRTGKRCIVLQGAHDTVTGKGGGGVIDYSCGSNLFLIRGIDRRQETWRIRAARSTPHAVAPYSLAGWVPIETAWFGGNN